MPLSPLEQLRVELAEKSQPRLAKCSHPPSRIEKGKERARECLSGALARCEMSHRAAARWLHVDDRTFRDWLTGARTLPDGIHFAMPRDVLIAYLQLALTLVPDVDEPEEDDEPALRVG